MLLLLVPATTRQLLQTHTKNPLCAEPHTHTVKFESISHFLNGVNIPVGGDTQEEPERKADKALERPNKKKHLRINK